MTTRKIDVDVMVIEFLSVADPAFLVDYASDAEIHLRLLLLALQLHKGQMPLLQPLHFANGFSTFLWQPAPIVVCHDRHLFLDIQIVAFSVSPATKQSRLPI